ncbi:phytoene desaturase family protein [Streptomyces zingiberis]|uniref:NAD(P)/FAD-dependent oxidoreductase n=1 Tax=Streptomyces zingiberis TaxID=2053010 RepID=A0ABX1BXK1_9ACTN|nr:NAD(P)/FAD-dependent oxidoreductase [Streptomyces zingiberis]NJQ02385.1 NAD(P)/FAD-dependent oxidoreductase [Streptomyces zingiberis]
MARIAVIGAGTGAMAAAARLAVAGHRVTVYERSGTHGGALRRVERDGFAFGTGPGLLHLPAVFRDLFLKTGKEPLEACVGLERVEPASRHLFADGTDVALPAASRAGVVGALDAALGAGAGERWSALLGRAREAWEVTRRPLLEEPLAHGGDRAPVEHDPYPATAGRGPALLRRARRPRTLAGLGRRELRDPRLSALLESHALAYGLDPRTAPASAAVLPYLEHTFGSWSVRGGTRALAEALHDRCRARGVAFVFGAEVTGVVVEDGRATGLALRDGTHVPADAVVSGVDVRLLHGALLPPGQAGPPPSAHPGLGRFSLLLALRGRHPAGTAHRTVVHATAPEGERAGLDGDFERLCEGPTVVVDRPGDPALCPDEDHGTAVLTVTVPPHAASPAAPAAGLDWTVPGRAERFAGAVLAAADAAGLGLGGRVLWQETHTPADTERETGAPGGSVPGPALAGAGGAFLRAGNAAGPEGPRGLYRVGGSAHPGGGLPHTGMSGALVAGLLVHGAGWRGSA